MCDFKVGDELVAIDNGGDLGLLPDLVVGAIYVCSAIDTNCGECCECHSRLGVQVEGIDCSKVAYCPCSFRKVQRRNARLTLEAFFKVPGGFEEPKRAPAKTPEHV